MDNSIYHLEMNLFCLKLPVTVEIDRNIVEIPGATTKKNIPNSKI